MALILKRITNPYECVRCSVTKKLITYGEEYYWDPIDNFVVDFEYYYDRKLAMKREEAIDTNSHKYEKAELEKQIEILEKKTLSLAKNIRQKSSGAISELF